MTTQHEALEQAKSTILELQSYIERMEDTPLLLATVVDTSLLEEKGTARVAIEDRIFEVEIGAGVEEGDLHPGDLVHVHPDSYAIFRNLGRSPGHGHVCLVDKVLDEALEVSFNGTSVRVRFDPRDEYEEGHRVIVTANGVMALRSLGKEKDVFAFEKDTGVSWADIGGLEEQKDLLQEAVELPVLYGDLYKAYGKKPIKGVLMEGPPGCGKTMLGKATATSLAAHHGGEGSGFIYVKGPEILNKWVGESEATIRSIFSRARQYKKDTGYPAVLFIDEAEAILSKRGTGISSDLEKTIVPQFLAEMDGLEDNAAMVLLATNRADRLDSAITRDGRIDRIVRVGRPTQEQATEIFKIYLGRVPHKNGTDLDSLSRLCAEELYSPTRVLYHINRKTGDDMVFTMASIVNGAMCAAVVDRATSAALKRDIRNKREAAKKSGIKTDDLVEAINEIQRSNQSLDHTDELKEMIGEFKDDVKHIHRTQPVAA